MLSMYRSLPLVLAVALVGCPAEQKPAATSSGPADTGASGAATGAAAPATVASGASTTEHVAAASGADYAHANELGLVPVMEYHRFGPKEERWTRTPANFRKDLEFFYNNGYYLVNARDLAERKLNVPAGKKPLVLTFDDATDVQFRYLKGADGKPDPNKIDPDCAVGMLDEMYKKHPDFGRAGTFYVLPSGFEQDGVIQQKFKYLDSTGREIGNHTWSHDNMSTMSVDKVNQEIGKDQHFIHQQLGDSYEVKTLALPFGIGPKNDAAFKAVSDGGSGADAHHFKALFLVGANPNVSPYDKRYKPTAVARIQGIDSEFKNWFNRKPGSTDKVKEPWVPYVSDGDPSKVTFPKASADKLNQGALGAGVTANPFDPTAAASAAPASQAPSAAPSTAASASMPASPQAQGAAGSDTVPGYATKLPAGAQYANGKLTYKIKSGDSTEDIAWKLVKFTDFYTYTSLAKAIRAENHLEKGLTVGDTINIPKARTAPPHPTIVAKPKDFEAKGIYVTGTIAGSGEVWDLVKDLKAHGGNTVVFDAKDMNGVITYKSNVPLAKEIKAYKGDMIQDLPKFIEKLHAEGIHAVARVAQFHDQHLVAHKPQYALISKKTGKPWRENGDLVWVDASMKDVQDYNLALAKELIANGVDEIQLDYVRFPAMGETSDITWSTAKTTQKEKHDVITAYVTRAHDELAPTKALLSADVYGVVAWDQGIDVRITGQKLEELGHHLDALSPMLYPSHFYADFDHFSYPPDHPQYFIGEGVRRTAKKIEGTGCTIRPWLQAFPYRIHNYGPQYVAVQLKANQEANGHGWLLWNAENSYKTGFNGVTMFAKGGLPNEQMPKTADDAKKDNKVAAKPKK